MIKYKLRAECLHDINVFLESRTVGCFTIVRPSILPDVQFTFESDLALDDIKSILKTIPDGHVMVETVALEQNYTGERN